MSKVAIFASGAGSNAEQIIRFFQKTNGLVSIQTIVCNNPNAGVISIAEQYNIPIKLFTNKEIENTNGLISFLKEEQIEWIVLAGFLRKIEPKIIQEYEDRIINLHPSLLPKYGGKGMYGKHVHHAVLEAEEQESGISIHLVNEEFDKGRILFQAKCKIKKGQTVVELSQKIQKLEHKFFPKVIEETILKTK